MVPSHIKASNLSQIVLNAETSLTSKHNKEAVEDKTIQEIYDALMSSLPESQGQNNILDLEFLMNEARKLTDAESEQPGEAADLLDKIQSQYMQNCGFFEAFQKNGGVKKFIYVALVSLELWTDKKVAESWKQWLKELDMFSEIPQYFQ